MRQFLPSAALAATIALGSPGIALAQNVPQLLQGMMTGNQGQDQKIRDAYERGYQKGRQDEAQLARDRRPGNDRGFNDRQGPDRRPQQPYDSRENDYHR